MSNWHDKYMEKCSASLIIREIQMETTNHHTSIRMATIKTNQKHKIASVGKHMKNSEPLYTVSGNVAWCSRYGKTSVAVPQKIKYGITM